MKSPRRKRAKLASTETGDLAKQIYTTVKESPTPTEAEIQGEIPKWLKGSFLRVGPGKFEWGDTKYNHWFDGAAILNRFEINDGKVNFSSRFLRSHSYVESERKGRIAVSQCATNAAPDPCRNIFARFSSYFDVEEESDNCNVSIVKMKGEIYASAEWLPMWKIDPNSLESLKRMNMHIPLPGTRSWTSHPHFEEDGAYYNCSANFDKKEYDIIRVPGPKEGHDGIDDVQIVASVPYQTRAAYMHSFGMTENYFIVIEGSQFFEEMSEAERKLKNLTQADLMYFDGSAKSKLHLIDRKSGKVGAVYEVDPFMCFHQINSYETENEVVFDTCFYHDGSVMEDLYLRNLYSGQTKEIFPAELRRYHLSLAGFNPDKPVTVEVVKDASGHDYDLIHPSFEMPKINYKVSNGKKYQYTYGNGNSAITSGLTTLLKINVDTMEVKIWQSENCYPSEPEFVASPTAVKEDEGVILSAVLGVNGTKSFLLVLDAETMTELAKAYVPDKLIPLFHVTYNPLEEF